MSAACAMSGRSIRVSERISSVADVIRRNRRIALDSNVLIYLLEGHGPRAESAAQLVDAIGRGEIEGVIASVGLAEVLVPSARADDGPLFERTAATVRDLGLRLGALDGQAAEDAAWIRGRTGASMPDAIHLACAVQWGATAFVTNDRRMPSLPRLALVILDDLVA
jgi:predicted nucleic acid-binding protein